MIKLGTLDMIPIESIEISDRARQELGDLQGLEESIKKDGLAQPLAVQDLGNGSYKLIAGERRFGVLMKNNIPKIPVRIYPTGTSLLELKSIELAENFYRKDFEYWEYDNLVAEIHKLKQEVHGVKIDKTPEAKGWSMADTGSLMGVTKASISTAVKRSDARSAFPELFKDCKTQKDATKVLDKLNEAAVKEALAKKIKESKTENKLVDLAKNFYVADFFEGIKKLPNSSVHLVEVDPPYAVNLMGNKKSDGISKYTDDYNEVSIDNYPEFMHKVFTECYRVMADHSWIVCWFAHSYWYDTILKLMEGSGFYVVPMCGIWTKGAGQTNSPNTRLASTFETFFYGCKGKPALAKPGRANDFRYSPVPPQYKTHPTERPVELIKEIYETFTWQGSRILIPFLGSGSGLIAAHQAGMNALGFELSSNYYDSFLVKLSKGGNK